MDNIIQYGTLNKDGALTNARTMKQSTIGNCPFYIFLPDHYREDGTCKCSNAKHRKMMIKEWDYSKANFINISLID